METKQRLGSLSSCFIYKSAIALWGILALASGFFGHPGLTAFLLFLFFLSLLSRIWGRRALKNVSVDIQGRTAHLFAGQEAEVTYTMKNDKLLPLTWLELVQPRPQNGCMEPDGDFEPGEMVPAGEAAGGEKIPVMKKTFAYLLMYQTVKWTTVWKAKRRGVYQLPRVLLRSGDGLGLTQTEAEAEVPSCPGFVVYPRLQPVRLGGFLRELQNAQIGTRGLYEDKTVLKGVREYQRNDSWKSINWRMAARTQPLQVNVYEVIQPRTVHLLFDAASFAGRSEENEELEEAMSIVASVLVGLYEKEVCCTLTLSGGRGSQTGLSEQLLALAGYEGTREDNALSESGLSFLQEDLGRGYFITFDEESFRAHPLAGRLGGARVTLLDYGALRGLAKGAAR